MLGESEKKSIIDEILESPEFKDSKRYKDLLLYLCRESLEGRAPKEITIGTDFFHKDYHFDPKEDPTVRVYLNNLRKKIEHYYLTSEKEHPIRIEIPKGRYQVEFIKIEKKDIKKPINKLQLSAIIISFIAIISVIFSIINSSTRKTESSISPDNLVWSEFIKPGGRPTLVLLGDFFFLFERNPEEHTSNFVRNTNINNLDDFKAMIKQNPKLASRYVKSDFTFLRPSASWGLAQILPILKGSPNGYSLKLASEFTVEDLKGNNIIFIGSFKTLYSLNKFLHIFGFEYNLSPISLSVKGEPGDTSRIFRPLEIKGGNYEKDFAVVAKGSGPEGSTMLLLLGFSDSGVIESSRAVVDTQILSLLNFHVSSGLHPDWKVFTMVIETEGINQSIFKSQISYLIQYPSYSISPTPQTTDTSKNN